MAEGTQEQTAATITTPEGSPETALTGEPAAPQQTETPEGGQQEQGAPDPLMERLDTSLQQFAERLDGLEETFGGPEGEEGFEPEGGQQGQGEGGEDHLDLLELMEENPQAVLGMMRDQAREEIRNEMAPVLDRFRDQDLQALETEFPELATREGAAPVVAAARGFAEQFGSPDLVEDPGFVRMVYLAGKASQQAEQETPANGQPQTQLESGGATPSDPQPSQFERIGAQQSDPARKFWGVG